MGVLLFTTGTGSGLTITTVDVLALHPLLSVTVTEYVPDMPTIPLGIMGFCNVELKLFGPLQIKVLIIGVLLFSDFELIVLELLDVRLIVKLVQIGELLPIIGIGNGWMITAVEIVAVQLLTSDTVTTYVPDIATVELVKTGF